MVIRWDWTRWPWARRRGARERAARVLLARLRDSGRWQLRVSNVLDERERARDLAATLAFQMHVPGAFGDGTPESADAWRTEYVDETGAAPEPWFPVNEPIGVWRCTCSDSYDSQCRSHSSAPDDKTSS